MTNDCRHLKCKQDIRHPETGEVRWRAGETYEFNVSAAQSSFEAYVCQLAGIDDFDAYWTTVK
jgi:hypothetical protein